MNGLNYLLQANFYLLLSYLFYLVLLRNETFFKMNRFFLVGTAVISLIIPILKTDWIRGLFVTRRIQEFTNQVNSVLIAAPSNGSGVDPIKIETKSLFTLGEWLWIAYGAIALFLLLNILRKLYLVNRILKQGNKGQAFSFFNKIAVDEDLEGKDTIIKHELVHVQQWHSADVIFFELLAAVNWLNPVVYFYKKSIRNIHEFIADETAASILDDKSAYALLLVSNAFNTRPQQLINSFYNQSLLKRRIIMLNKTKSSQVAILKYGLSTPLFAGMIIFSSATTDAKIITQITEKITPVIEQFSAVELKSVKEVKQQGTILKINTDQATNARLKKPNRNKLSQDISKNLNPGNKALPENLNNYIDTFFKAKPLDFPNGIVWFSFDVNKQKQAYHFKITKSINSTWENELLTYLGSFKDTVNLKQGTYSFFKGFALGENEQSNIVSKTGASKTAPNKVAFIGTMTTSGFAYTTSDETKKDAGKIVNYIKADYIKDPVILVDGKEAAYKLTDKGFRLDETIYPKKANIEIYIGEKAIEQYGESARKGLIVVTTTEKEGQ